MKIFDRIDNYLSDKEYKIIIKNNLIDIINYDEIIDFSPLKISVKYNNKIIIVDGLNLTICKMQEDEVLISGNISNIRINQI